MSDKVRLDSWQSKLIDLMLDAYERTGTYRGDVSVRQKIRIPVQKIFPDYEKDDAEVSLLAAFEQSMRDLEKFSPIRIVYKDRKIRSEFLFLIVPAGAVEPALYDLIGRKPKREIHAEQIAVYEKYRGRHPLLDTFISAQEELLMADKNAWFPPDAAEDVMRIVDLVVHNTSNILYREISIALFGDTKYIERHNCLPKVLRVLKGYGSYDFEEADFDSDKEYEAAILAEYAVYENPTYVNFNGDGEITFRNGTLLELKAGVPIAVRSDRITDITGIQVDADTVLTIENLTSYNRLQTGAFQLYLAGYHNRARQDFLVRIHEQNPETQTWLHFGDLDPDGFCILENLRKKTGIDFRSFGMDLSYLQQYETYAKPLTDNDRVKAEHLLEEGKYTDILTYMLHYNVKLEQEIISWQEAGTWGNISEH
jgi:hypothetical protein